MSPLDPYMGEWTSLQAAHLLRRTTYATSRDTIQDVVDNGLSFTIDQLFSTQALPDPPINYGDDMDQNTPIGSTWINQVVTGMVNRVRNRSLNGWTINNILSEGVNIRERMVVFWHNHLVTAAFNDPRMKYQYIDLIRRHATGNFKDLVAEMTISPTMLYYLNGRQNRVGSPNENYARELLELFTLGKGDLAGPGDYTFFTEQDVEELAKALTGWRAYGNQSSEVPTPFAEYDDDRHDKTTKTLSPRLGSESITNNGANEYLDVINIIFQQSETANFICRKLYRYFLQENITPSIEVQVIDPLAEILRNNNYDIEPVLRILLGSEHFYDVNCIGTMIKNPVEQVVGLLNTTKTSYPQDDVTKHLFGHQFWRRARDMQMEYYNPPNVAGWKAYYQEPSYYRQWITSVTLPERIDLIEDLVMRRIRQNEYDLRIDPLAYVDQIPTDISTDPNKLIEDLATVFFCLPLDPTQITALKEVLIPGLPDFEWTVEYGLYLDPATTSDELKQAITNKLKSLFFTMLTMPESFLC